MPLKHYMSFGPNICPNSDSPQIIMYLHCDTFTKNSDASQSKFNVHLYYLARTSDDPQAIDVLHTLVCPPRMIRQKYSSLKISVAYLHMGRHLVGHLRLAHPLSLLGVRATRRLLHN